MHWASISKIFFFWIRAQKRCARTGWEMCVKICNSWQIDQQNWLQHCVESLILAVHTASSNAPICIKDLHVSTSTHKCRLNSSDFSSMIDLELNSVIGLSHVCNAELKIFVCHEYWFYRVLLSVFSWDQPRYKCLLLWYCSFNQTIKNSWRLSLFFLLYFSYFLFYMAFLSAAAMVDWNDGHLL